ncbi:MAG: 16S rRNA processing protein RimM [Fimbriimonadaceae bacterium]|nr:16S rRNA processing protein RimM [Fimbriimonadaceae bacterium]
MGAFGIKGQVKVLPLTDFVEARFDPDASLFLHGEKVEMLDISEHKGHLIIRFKGVNDRNQAETLQWEYLEAPEDERPELDEDTFMIDDLIGLEVFTSSGERLGNVSEVLLYPANDLLVVGEHEIPMVREFVKEIDLEKKRVTVELIEGM